MRLEAEITTELEDTERWFMSTCRRRQAMKKLRLEMTDVKAGRHEYLNRQSESRSSPHLRSSIRNRSDVSLEVRRPS
ncbi:hypothetical protein J6590_092814 [Homalodisca vitripennis]|nr:hypothetical protein J6590_092814 [Homalodisca vitripennis]